MAKKIFTSPWMTPSSPTRPKPKSLRCFSVNLFVTNDDYRNIQIEIFTFDGHSNIVHPKKWCPKENLCIFLSVRVDCSETLFFPESDLKYREITVLPLPHHSSLKTSWLSSYMNNNLVLSILAFSPNPIISHLCCTTYWIVLWPMQSLE